MKFQILIPTYNRAEILHRNLSYLLQQIKDYNLQSDVGVIVSDNASTDETFAILNSLTPLFSIERIEYKIYRNEENIGLEANAVQALSLATSEYVIWVGDDDFLPDGFLEYVIATFKTENIGWMLTAAISEYSDGSRTDTYGIEYDEKKFPEGYSSIWEVSHYGHKMSGLVVKREGMLESYISNPQWRNLYLFIYFLAYNQIRYPGIFAAKYKVLVNNYNKKDFDYNSIGLLDEVFKSYNYLIDIYGMRKVIKLLLRFVIVHSYRITFTKGFSLLIKQWKIIYQSYEFGRKLKWSLLRILVKEYTNQNIYLPVVRFIRNKG